MISQHHEGQRGQRQDLGLVWLLPRLQLVGCAGPRSQRCGPQPHRCYMGLDANHVSGDLSSTSPGGNAATVTPETYPATDAAGSAGALGGGVAVGTNVYAVSSNTGSAGRSHIVVCTKSVLVELSTPMALALTDEGLSVFAVSFGNLDLDALQIGGGLSFTPPGNPSSLAWG